MNYRTNLTFTSTSSVYAVRRVSGIEVHPARTTAGLLYRDQLIKNSIVKF